jgi:hypothetical protein
MNNTFQEDLTRGKQIEQQLLDKLKVKYPSATIIDKYKGYDIWIPEINKSIEVKADEKSNYTGNIVVEIEMFGKPSALMTTTADYWVFYDGKFWCITPKEIIQCIFLNKLQHTEFVGNGDTQSKKAFLIKKEFLAKYWREIK